ncbi:MAG TPA: SH3 domain-containing protein [Anaerolineales bacterium]|nr:SH3 domain-containing protein [Anaerolineales bacterium]
MNKWPQVAAVSVVILSILACSMPTSDQVSFAATAFAQTQTAQALVSPSPAPGSTAAPPPSPTTAPPTAIIPPTACSPIVTANVNANVRGGDSTDYDIIGFLSTGTSAPLMGRNAADTWWYITYGGGHGWIAKSVVTAFCLPATVAVVVPPPPPPTPTVVVAEFAVTSVSYSFSQADYGGQSDCPMVTANITVNGPGDITYRWTRSDNASGPTDSLHFNAAGTKSVSENWALGATWEGTEHWLGIYIDDPNHQDFGHKTFTDACNG